MSEQNVTIVRAVYDSFAAGDVAAVFAAMTPDIEWDESEGMPYGGVYHGPEAIVSNGFGPILAVVEGFTAAPDEILPLTRVVALGRYGGQGANGPVVPGSCTSGRSPTAWCRATSSLPTRTPSESLSASSSRRPERGRPSRRYCVAARTRLRR
jgi:hypothetical protein